VILEYQPTAFHPATGWYLLDWIKSAGTYRKTPMPGWLTMIELVVGIPGGYARPTDLQSDYPPQRYVPARYNPFTGELEPAAQSPMFYRILGPGEPDPLPADFLDDWNDWNARMGHQTLRLTKPSPPRKETPR
jgi:hypothetical protein